MGGLMTHSISIEITIPENVDTALVIKIGEASYPYDVAGPMELDEAIQWAFATTQGVTDLANLGVTWLAQHQ